MKKRVNDPRRASNLVDLMGAVYVGWGRLWVLEHGMCVEEVVLVDKMCPLTDVMFFFVCIN